MTSRILMLNTAMTALVALATPVQLSAQTLITFDPANSTNTQVNGITQAGEITGYFCDSIGCHGFLRAAKGAITTIDATPTSNYTNATAINPGGMITGYWGDAGMFGPTNCFLRAADGTITTFNPPGAITSYCL